MGNIRQTSNRILEEWREGKIGRKKALKELSSAKKQVKQDIEENSGEQEGQMNWDSLIPGREIYCPAWGKSGSIVETDAKTSKLKINLGGVNIWMSPGEISTSHVSSKRDSKQLYQKTDPETPGLILDIRGFFPEEAEQEVSKFLDKALIQGRSKLEIIHGRGKGTLRGRVHSSLRNFFQVKDYYIAPEDRGGDGVTIVDLK